MTDSTLLTMDAVTMPRATLALCALAALAACETTLPIGPSELTSGIVIYEHANYIGQSGHVTEDVKDLRNVDDGPCETDPDSGSDWNDCISSIRVAPGWRASLYRNPDFEGESIDISSDVSNLQLEKGTCPHDGLNDCVTSIRIYRP